jgi:hypothetical protein
MQIASISSIPGIVQGSAALDASSPKQVSATSSTATAASKAPATTAAASAAPAKAIATAASPKPAAPAAPHGGGSGSTASSAAEELVIATYSTTVGGKSYSGSVQEQAGGQYVASVPNLPGATASGSSIQAAEDNLGLVINILA